MAVPADSDPTMARVLFVGLLLSAITKGCFLEPWH